MDSFQLADDAILDIDSIWLYLLEKEGVETADRVVTELFKGFYKLAENQTAGTLALTSRHPVVPGPGEQRIPQTDTILDQLIENKCSLSGHMIARSGSYGNHSS